MPEEIQEGMPETIDVAILAANVVALTMKWLKEGEMNWTELIALAPKVEDAVKDIAELPNEWKVVTEGELLSLAEAIVDELRELGIVDADELTDYAMLAALTIQIAYDVKGIVEIVLDMFAKPEPTEPTPAPE